MSLEPDEHGHQKQGPGEPYVRGQTSELSYDDKYKYTSR